MFHRNTNHTRKMSRYIVYYSCFFGKDDSVANKVPTCPSFTAPCYFFSNNKKTLDKLKGSKWIGIHVDIPIKNTNRDNAMDSKEFKVCPNHFYQLRGYKYSCYFDSKLSVKEADVLAMIDAKLKNSRATMIVNRHPTIAPRVWDEFNEAMHQDRYSVNKDRYSSYIKEQLNSGLRNTVQDHYETSFIIRKSGPLTNRIGSLWLDMIKKTGIECQISFFFIQQLFPNYIVPTESTYGRA